MAATVERVGEALSPEVPPILTVRGPLPRVSGYGRLWAGLIAASCLAVLIVAALLPPSDRGYGTHEQLGLQPCGMLASTGVPCMTCGYTTSFSHFAKGNLWRAAVVQPGGLATAIGAAAAVWVGGYIAATGRPAHRALRLVPVWGWVAVLGTLALGGWAYKIVVTVS